SRRDRGRCRDPDPHRGPPDHPQVVRAIWAVPDPRGDVGHRPGPGVTFVPPTGWTPCDIISTQPEVVPTWCPTRDGGRTGERPENAPQHVTESPRTMTTPPDGPIDC